MLSYGFRPFFLLGAVYAGLSILFWLPVYAGHIETFSVFAPVDWHIHEMLFGYLAGDRHRIPFDRHPELDRPAPVLGLPLLVLVLSGSPAGSPSSFRRRSDGTSPPSSTWLSWLRWPLPRPVKSSSAETGAT